MDDKVATRLTKSERKVLRRKGILPPNLEPKFKLAQVRPLTTNQGLVLQKFEAGQNLALLGSAGTGKTFLACYAALREVLDGDGNLRKVVIVRSAVSTRDVGFQPGDAKQKAAVYEGPYEALLFELFDRDDAYTVVKERGIIDFVTTSFVRGLTFRNSIVIIDECQNLTFHELDSVVTRLGEGSRLVLCGDYSQTDFTRESDRAGLSRFIEIIRRMPEFDVIWFDRRDVVRSGLVKSYLEARDGCSSTDH